MNNHKVNKKSPADKVPKTWNPSFRMSVATMAALLDSAKDSVRSLRRLNAITPHPPTRPFNTKITKVKIPRSHEIDLNDLSEYLKFGTFSAEWVEDIKSPSSLNSRKSKSVVDENGDYQDGIGFGFSRFHRLRSSRSNQSFADSISATSFNSSSSYSDDYRKSPIPVILLDEWEKSHRPTTPTNFLEIPKFGRHARYSSSFSDISSKHKFNDTLSFSETETLSDFNPLNPEIRPTNEKVILFIHGGAFVFSSRKNYRILTSKLARLTNSRVLAIDYRQSPEHVFPCALHDAISAYRFLLDPPTPEPGKTASKYSPHNITVMGDSAGGNLAISLALWLREHGLEYNLPMPAGVIGLSPWLDLTHSQPSFILNGEYDVLPYASKDLKYINENRSHYYVGDNSFLKNPLVSPIFAEVNDEKFELTNREKIVAGKLENFYKCVDVGEESLQNFDEAERREGLQPLSPILLQVGSAERLYNESLVFASQTLRNSPSPVLLEVYEDMVHIHQMFPFESLANKAIKQMASFISTVCNDNTTSPFSDISSSATSISFKPPSPKNPRFIRHFVKFLNDPASDCPMVPLDPHPLEIVKEAERVLEKLKCGDENICIGGITLGGNKEKEAKSKMKRSSFLSMKNVVMKEPKIDSLVYLIPIAF